MIGSTKSPWQALIGNPDLTDESSCPVWVETGHRNPRRPICKLFWTHLVCKLVMSSKTCLTISNFNVMILWWYRIHCLEWLPSLVTSSTDSGSQPSSEAISKWPLPIGGLDAFARHPVFRCRNFSDQISMAQNRMPKRITADFGGIFWVFFGTKTCPDVQHFDFGNDKVRICQALFPATWQPGRSSSWTP